MLKQRNILCLFVILFVFFLSNPINSQEKENDKNKLRIFKGNFAGFCVQKDKTSDIIGYTQKELKKLDKKYGPSLVNTGLRDLINGRFSSDITGGWWRDEQNDKEWKNEVRRNVLQHLVEANKKKNKLSGTLKTVIQNSNEPEMIRMQSLEVLLRWDPDGYQPFLYEQFSSWLSAGTEKIKTLVKKNLHWVRKIKYLNKLSKQIDEEKYKKKIKTFIKRWKAYRVITSYKKGKKAVKEEKLHKAFSHFIKYNDRFECPLLHHWKNKGENYFPRQAFISYIEQMVDNKTVSKGNIYTYAVRMLTYLNEQIPEKFKKFSDSSVSTLLYDFHLYMSLNK